MKCLQFHHVLLEMFNIFKQMYMCKWSRNNMKHFLITFLHIYPHVLCCSTGGNVFFLVRMQMVLGSSFFLFHLVFPLQQYIEPKEDFKLLQWYLLFCSNSNWKRDYFWYIWKDGVLCILMSFFSPSSTSICQYAIYRPHALCIWSTLKIDITCHFCFAVCLLWYI